VGVYTSAAGGVVSSTVWANGTWGAPAAITAAAVARSQPSVDATGGTTSHVIYQDSGYDYWYLAYTGTWTSQPQALGLAGNQNYGPVAATIAARGANATAGFIDGHAPNVNYAAAADLTGGAWQAQVDPGPSGNFNIPATIIPLDAGADLMMVYVQCVDSGCFNTSQIYFMTRTSGTWTSPVAVTNALTLNQVALAPLPSGGAILAFRGTDTNLYWSVYASGAWSTVAAFASPNVAVDTTPAVTHGIGGDVAEMAYLSGGQAFHARLTGTTWSAPVLVGGTGLNGVAIAAAP
jgi:hypothetical protein